MTARVARVAAYRAATFPDIASFDAGILPLGDYRRLFGGVVLGVGSVTAAAAMAGVVTVTAAWMVSSSLTHNPELRAGVPVAFDLARLPTPPRRLADPADLFGSALASANPAYAPKVIREASLAPAAASNAAAWRVPLPSPPPPPRQQRTAEWTDNVPLPPPRPSDVGQARPQRDIARAPAAPAAPSAPQVATLAPPLRSRDVPPVHTTIAVAPAPVVPAAPAAPARPQTATLAPARTLPPESIPSRPAAKRASPQLAYNNPESLPALDSHTAIYDIAAHTVYLPDGERLEAHSGLGPMMDNPRYVYERDRGATPPNVYDLTLRSGLFHGVQAIRLNPVADSKMFGRAGILAHTYMLGPSGQSFGCVSFKHYREFLQAFRSGEISRMVVVPHLGTQPWADRVRRATQSWEDGARRATYDRFAFNE